MAAEHGTSSTNADQPPAPNGTPRQEAVDVAVEKLKNSTLAAPTSPSPTTEGIGKDGEAIEGNGASSSPSPRFLLKEEPSFTLLSGSDRAGVNDDNHTQSQKEKEDFEYDRALEVVFATQNAHRRKSSLVATDPNALTRMRDTGCIVHALLDEHKRKSGQASLADLKKKEVMTKDDNGVCGYGNMGAEENAMPQINSCIEEGLRRESTTGDDLGAERDRRGSVGSEGSEGSFYLTEPVEERRRRRSSMTSHSPHLSPITEAPPNGDPSNQPDARPKPGPPSSNPKHASSSKMLTKTQLSDMAWGVRELSQRLGSIKLHLKVRSVFILTKAFDTSLIYKTREVAEWLLSSSRDIPYIVYVEEKLRHNKKFNKEAICNATGRGEGEGCERLRFWNEKMCRESPQMFDFVITLGGDGTVLYASWLFQKVVPPVLSFALGSLGFLTQYDFANFRETLTEGFRDGVRVSLRLRFEGTVMRAVRRKRIRRRAGDAEEKPDLEGNAAPVTSSPFPISSDSDSEAEDSADEDRDLVDELLSDEAEDAPTHIPTNTFSILNDIIIDRGPSPTLTTLEIFTSSGSSDASGPANSYAQSGKEEDKCGGGGPGASSSRSGMTTHLTTLLGDGLCISTPTGSTAYNLAASGPLSHPSNPIILLTAICAHSLSFRPLVLPDSIVLRVGVPYDARQGAWAAFDGRERVRLGRGDYVSVRAGRWPFSNVGNEGEWEGGLKSGLGWNCRGGGKQKKFDK